MKAIAAASTGVVWQGKSLFSARSSNHLADQLIDNRSAIMFLHDEGGMHQVKAWPNHVLKTHRIEYLRKRNVNRVCVWGERQKEVLSSYAEELEGRDHGHRKPKIRSMPAGLCLGHRGEERGNPRQIRPLHPGLHALRDGRALGRAGRSVPAQDEPGAVAGKPRASESLADLWFSKWQRDVHDFADFVVLTKELALNFPQYTVVLRPHPSESMTFYQQAFASFKNVAVTRDESVLPWIRAAELVVHSNCTTGIEAVLAGRPVLNLLPECEGRTELDVEVAREAGYVAGSVGEALQKAGDFLSGEAPAYEWSPHAKTILNNLTLGGGAEGGGRDDERVAGAGHYVIEGHLTEGDQVRAIRSGDG